ncbi:MAG: hypothetical protein NTY69_00940 [Methylococcales bacterium]|nr:hypothetical protein [Methylococcales bacterium]
MMSINKLCIKSSLKIARENGLLICLLVSLSITFPSSALAKTTKADSITDVALTNPTLPSYCDQNSMRAFPELPVSLKCVPAPEPYMIDNTGNKISIYPSIVKDKASLIALGKIFFWDSQVGSDGLACGSCHFNAGADNRTKNQINPGMRNSSDKMASDGKTPIGNVFTSGKGPNYKLTLNDFPLRKYKEPEIAIENLAPQNDRNAEVIKDSDDIVSSQGAYHAIFTQLSKSGKKEKCINRFSSKDETASIFTVAGNYVRQVEPRNTPTVINAVYNFRNFWDGRANNIFNGIDSYGMRTFSSQTDEISISDSHPEIYIQNQKGKLVKQRLTIFNASLASEAVGPALSSFEMTCGGKKFAQLAKKMLALKPLNNQIVDPTDSVLGRYAKPGLGLKAEYTYKSLIQQTFNEAYWNVSDKKKIDGYKLIENNFSLFWGLAVQAYEATLVSDDSRFDRAQEDPALSGGDFTEQEINGKNLFVGKGQCINCHVGAEFTSASVSHVENAENATDIGKYIQRMIMGDGGVALYDDGFYNTGVRPTEEDIGLGSDDPYGYPLSFTRNAKRNANDPFDMSIINAQMTSLAPDILTTNSTLFAQNIGCINWNPNTTASSLLCGTDPIIKDERDAVDGAFKTPGLRNVELTGPYFHNGGQATLEQVVQFYNRGGDREDKFNRDLECANPILTLDTFGNTIVAPDSSITGLIDSSGYRPFDGGNPSNLAADMAGSKQNLDVTCNSTNKLHETLNLTSSDIDDLVAFLKTLTDERVRLEKAPFDHPSLVIPNGSVGNSVRITSGRFKENLLTLPAIGAGGRPAKNLPELKSFASVFN